MDDVIDFRFRPVGAQSWNRDTTYHYLDRMQLDPTPSFAAQSEDLMFAEMQAAGIAVGVIGVPGPTNIRGLDPKSSDSVRELVDTHLNRFVWLGSVDPRDIESAALQIRTLAASGVKGVTIDLSTATLSRQFHDRALYPLYEEAAAGGILVTTTQSCLLGPYTDDCRPEYVDHVATDFPELTVVIHYDFPGSADYVHALRRQCGRQETFSHPA